MNKAQLIDAVARRMRRDQAELAVETVLDAIVRAVVEGERVAVTGFGSFERHHLPARKARNPQNGEPVQVPASFRARFRMGENFRELLNGKSLPPLDQSAVSKAPKGSKQKKGN
jgi:DNA-binding protein HU-beta